MSEADRTIDSMPPTCEPQLAREFTPAELVNEEIRAFMWARAGRPLHTEESAEYRRLLEHWWAAEHAELVQAA